MGGTTTARAAGDTLPLHPTIERERNEGAMPTVLIADDDRKITDMLRRTLAYEGYQVLTAASGE